MPNITIYSTPSCVYCKIAKEFLKTNNVAYTEKDVASDSVAREEMIKKSGQLGVQVIDIDGEIIIGFDKTYIAKKVGIVH